MRIAYAMINCNRRDGSARAVNEVSERMAMRGHDVHIYARKVEDLDLSLVRWHQVPGPSWPEIADFYSYYLYLNNKLASHSYDIVHSVGINTARANVFTIQNIQSAKDIILQQLDSQTSVSLPRQFTRKVYYAVTAAIESKLYTSRQTNPLPLFLPVSNGVEAELRKHYAIGNAPVCTIPNGADVDNFHPLPINRVLGWRNQQGIPPDVTLAIFAGGEWARKGLHLAINALARMQNRSLWLYVAGDDPDRERFKQLAALVGVDSRVIFGGFRRDVEIAMASGDLFLFPSFYEAFSLATIEAAACGLPIVATKINGTEDFIIPSQTGEFVRHDPSDIAAVLDRLCADIPKLQLMGRSSRQRVEAKYTWDRVADMTENAYIEYLALVR